MDPDEAQARVQVAAHLYRRAVLSVMDTLRGQDAPPLTPEEKMRIHASVEPAAWELPADLFVGDGSEAWLEAALDDPRARRVVDEAARAFLRERAA